MLFLLLVETVVGVLHFALSEWNQMCLFSLLLFWLLRPGFMSVLQFFEQSANGLSVGLVLVVQSTNLIEADHAIFLNRFDELKELSFRGVRVFLVVLAVTVVSLQHMVCLWNGHVDFIDTGLPSYLKFSIH